MRAPLAFTGLFLALAGSMLLLAFGFESLARRVPVVILLPTFCLMLLQFCLDLRNVRRGPGPDREARPIAPAPWPSRLWARPEFQAVAVVVVIGVAVHLLGIVIAVPLLLGLFLRFAAGALLRQALAASAVILGIIELGLHRLLAATLPAGQLWLWLGL